MEKIASPLDITTPIIDNLNKRAVETMETIRNKADEVIIALAAESDMVREIEGDVHILNYQDIAAPIVQAISANTQLLNQMMEDERVKEEEKKMDEEEKGKEKDGKKMAHHLEMMNCMMDIQDGLTELKAVMERGVSAAEAIKIPEQQKIYLEEINLISSKLDEVILSLQNQQAIDMTGVVALLTEIRNKDWNIAVSGSATLTSRESEALLKVPTQQIDGTQKTNIVDGSGRVWTMESNGAMPINIQDQHTDLLDVFMIRPLQTVTLAQTYVMESYTVVLEPGHSLTVGNYLAFKQGPKFSQAQILSINTNTITLDRPLDFEFTSAANVIHGTVNLNVNGSVTPQIYRITAANLTVDLDITRLIFTIEGEVKMDTNTFGGIPALTRGIIVRKTDGTHNTIFNAKTNGGFGLHCDIIQYDDRAPAGVYGFRAVRKFAGQAESGVTVRLNANTNDQIEVVVQDDLSALSGFRIVVQGHVVENL